MSDLQTHTKKRRESRGRFVRIIRGIKQPPNDEGRLTDNKENAVFGENSATEDYTISDISTAPPVLIPINAGMKYPSELARPSILRNFDINLGGTTVNLSTAPGERPSVFLRTSLFWPTTCETSDLPGLAPIHSDTCIISQENLYEFSVLEELHSALKVSIWAVLSTICGIGYEGRTTISTWYGILETIHHYPAALGIAAGSYTVFDIIHEALHRKLIFLLLVTFHSVLITAIQLELLIFGHLVNTAIASFFCMAVYFFCSSQFYVRAFWFILWFSGVLLLFGVVLLMLQHKLWT